MGFNVMGEPGLMENQYPHLVTIHYPKPGAPNPTVSLFVADIQNSNDGPIKPYEIDAPLELANEENILSTVSWVTNDTLVATWMNRVQNLAIIQSCTDKNCTVLNKLISNDMWIELFTPPLHNKDGTKLALITSQQQGSAGGYRHLTLIEKDKITPLTSGKYVVQDLLKWDAESNYIFYDANIEGDSKVLHIYGIKAEPNSKPVCLTCDLKYEGNDIYSYYVADFTEGNYVIINAAGPSIPRMDIYRVNYNNNTVNLSLVREWDAHNALRNFLRSKSIPTIEFDTIRLDNGFDAEVIITLPPNIDRSGATLYPMLIEVYAGPDSYTVTDRFNIEWGTYVASRGVVFVKIDGRGSGLRGDQLLLPLYRKLGTVEIDDQIETAKKLQNKYKFISKNHTAIWGWSYGGFSAFSALANDDERVIDCAAAVAPVTDWTLYGEY